MLEMIQTLQAANARLKLTPEANSPFNVFYHVNPSSTADELKVSELLTWTGHSPETPVEQLDFSNFTAFFSNPNHSADLSESFTALETILQEQLTNLRIYRIGPATVAELYCIGQDAEGNFAGLKQATAND